MITIIDLMGNDENVSDIKVDDRESLIKKKLEFELIYEEIMSKKITQLQIIPLTSK